MKKDELINIAAEFLETSTDNYIKKENAISEKYVGMKIFESPIFAFGNANDIYFEKLKEKYAVGNHFNLPLEWIPQGKTVISYFLPFSDVVKKGNSKNITWPSEEWLHGRIEGQMMLNKLSLYLKEKLSLSGYSSIIPSLDDRFWSKGKIDKYPKEENYNQKKGISFTSNWSERHVAFVCGLGTFGLSRGLITKKGMAGRFGSIVTELEFAPTEREYKDIYEYCTKCGECISQCPVGAISYEKGKDHEVCSQFLEKIKGRCKPRYGCGKCQVNVSCESSIPMNEY